MTQPIRILLADDDQDDHDFFEEALRNLAVPYEIRHAFDGIQALQYLNDVKSYSNAADLLPHIVVLDLNMPKKDGFSVLADIRGDNSIKHMPVFILSTSVDPAHVTKCLILGSVSFYSKAPTLKELTQIISKILDDFTNLRPEQIT